jgi:hypothetical protein
VTTEAEGEGKKTNIIVTYAELYGIREGVQLLHQKVDHQSELIGRIGDEHTDHEIRIRALELTQARQSGGQGLAQWATPILLSLGMAVLAVLSYFK